MKWTQTNGDDVDYGASHANCGDIAAAVSIFLSVSARCFQCSHTDDERWLRFDTKNWTKKNVTKNFKEVRFDSLFNRDDREFHSKIHFFY